MKAPRGFGRRYFTLAAIQAYSAQIALDKIVSISKPLSRFVPQLQQDDEEDPPPLPKCASFFTPTQSSKPCHCNCYFKKKAKEALILSKKRKKCLCHSKYFSFRRSGIHPPIYTVSL